MNNDETIPYFIIGGLMLVGVKLSDQIMSLMSYLWHFLTNPII